MLNATATTTATVETRGATAATQGVFKVQVDFDGPVTLVNAANITVTYTPTIQSPLGMDTPVSVIPSSVVMSDADTLDMIFTAGQIPSLVCNIAIGVGHLPRPSPAILIAIFECWLVIRIRVVPLT